jgi:plasmid stability protein
VRRITVTLPPVLEHELVAYIRIRDPDRRQSISDHIRELLKQALATVPADGADPQKEEE